VTLHVARATGLGKHSMVKNIGRRFPRVLAALEAELTKLADEIFANLTPWQKVQLSRHPDRPYTLKYIQKMTENLFSKVIQH
jgi:acetyl-CoA carboxylase carboxyl transferase subunit alpha